jgi:hypothetical protein
VLTLGATLSNGTYTYTLPAATGTLALTSDIPVVTGFVPYTGATADVNLGIYTLTASGVDSVGYTARGSGTLSGYLIIKQGTTYLGNVVGYNSINANARKYVFISDVDGTNYKSAIFELSSLTNNTDRTYTLPDASGTIALVGGAGVGTVTSVAALTIGTTGTDLSSTVATSTTTPVITLNVPTASATNRGALSSADWTTFNNKQSALTNPVTGTGTTNYLPKFTGASTIGNSNLINDASGNLGLGVTPSAWSTGSAFEIGSWAGFGQESSNGYTLVTGNAYYNGTSYRYRNSAAASMYQLDGPSSGHRWYNAPSGTAGNAISFTQAMTLDASGRLALGRTSADHRLDVQGNILVRNTLANASFYFAQEGDNSSTFYQYNNGTLKNVIASNGVSYFNGGNVLIGTTTDAGYKLDVNGTGRFSGNDLSLQGGAYPAITAKATATFPIFSLINDAQTAQWNIELGRTVSGNLEFYNSGTKISFTPAGAATFSSSVTLTSGYLSVDAFGNKDTNYITMRSGFAPSDTGGIGFKAIDHSGSGTDGLACYGHDGISLYTAQTERMRITSAGITQLKPATGDLALEVFYGATSTGAMIGDASNFIIGGQTSKGLVFCTNNLGQEKMRITTGGNVLIGTTTDDTVNKLQVNGNTISTGYKTLEGTVSAPYNVPTLVQSCGTNNGNPSMYLIITSIGGAGSDRIAMAILVTISQGSGTARFALQSNGGLMSLTDPLSNGTIYVTQSTAGTQTVGYRILRIG